MTEIERLPRAIVVLAVNPDRELVLGTIAAGARCDLALLDHLLRLQLAARRRGWSIRLDAVHPHLRALLDLVAVEDVLGAGRRVRSGLDAGGQAELGEQGR